jgi:alpha-beta hydrolase superfamily lysophospholipase
MGSNMALALCSEHPELADGAILGSPCYKRRLHPKPLQVAKDIAREVVKPNKPLNLEPYAAPYLTNDPALAQACDSDPMINREITPAELIKIDIMNNRAFAAAKNLPSSFPVLIIAGSKDEMFKSIELPEEVKKFGSKNVSVQILSGKGHLLMEHQRVNRPIAALIDSWLARQNASSSLANAAGPQTTGTAH